MGTLHGRWAYVESRIGGAPRPKDPHPRIESGAGSNPLPRGDGEEQPEISDEGSGVA